MSAETMKSYVRQVVAKLTGDTAKVTAEQNYRTAIASIEVQLAGLNYNLIKADGVVEKAKEKLSDAKYPSSLISDGETYLSRIHSAKENLESAESEVANIKASIAFNEALKAEFNAD